MEISLHGVGSLGCGEGVQNVGAERVGFEMKIEFRLVNCKTGVVLGQIPLWEGVFWPISLTQASSQR